MKTRNKTLHPKQNKSIKLTRNKKTKQVAKNQQQNGKQIKNITSKYNENSTISGKKETTLNEECLTRKLTIKLRRNERAENIAAKNELQLNPKQNDDEKLSNITSNQDNLESESNHESQNTDNNIISEDLNMMPPEEKTTVQISFNGGKVYWVKIKKSPNSITLSDIKKRLMNQPTKFGIDDVKMYEFNVQTTKNGVVGFEECEEEYDDDISIMPLFDGCFVLECWSK